jgi:proton-translocating NADH-quinone oxidoreductase chain M
MMLLEAASTPATPAQLPALLLSAMVWVPALGAIGLLFFPVRTDLHRERIRSFAIATAGVVLGLAVLMWYGFRDQSGTFAYEENRPWLPAAGASYHLGVDGVSMTLLLLSAFLFVFAVLASSRVREQTREYFILLLILETGVNGVFASLDYLLFFLFWQLQAVPLFLLIARFGGSRRLQTAWKFLAIDLLGSGLLLTAILILYFKAPQQSFDMATLHGLAVPSAPAGLLVWLFFIAFAVKLPALPLHTWFIDAQAEASAPVAVIVAGLLSKLGGYGVIRVDVGQFQAAFHKIVGAVVVIALATIIWGALAALAQDNLRRLVGYLVMVHMGLVLLAAAAAAPIAINGAVLLMVGDGLTAGLLVLLAAAVAERTNTSSIQAMGGLAARMPRAAIVGFLGAIAAVGLPGAVGFVGQILVALGAYPTHRLAVWLALLGVVTGAGATVWAVQRVFFGPLAEHHGRIRDLGTLELVNGVGLLSLIVLLGVLPAILMDSINFSVLTLLTRG